MSKFKILTQQKQIAPHREMGVQPTPTRPRARAGASVAPNRGPELGFRQINPRPSCFELRVRSTQRASSGCPPIIFQETNTARRERPGRRNTKARQPRHEEKATHTRRNRHDHNRKQDLVNSSGCGISSCEVSSDLARPGKYSCEVSSHLEKIYLFIEHNHQSFEQPDTTFCCSQFSETPSIPRSTRP